MKNIPVYLIPLVLLLHFSDALLPNLDQISEEGSKYITTQIENALNGVRQMKVIMDKTGQEHQEIMRTLEQTKKNKEDALKEAMESEQQLSKMQEMCNETVLALWEECKPCLKQTCVRFYSKTCRSGSGLVGRQFEDFLNTSSPFSLWINGGEIDSLSKQDEHQHMTLEDLEDGYSVVEESVDEIFQDSIKAFEQMRPLFTSPFLNRFTPDHWNPFPLQRLRFPSLHSRKERSPRFDPYFTGNFESLFEAAQKMMERHHQLLQQGPRFNGGGTSNSTDDKLVCRELRRNSAGCLKMKDKCEKCQEILATDCSGKDLIEGKFQEKFQESVRLAEKFTRQYDDLLQSLRDKMMNSTGLLQDLSHSFSWVSRLANMTESDKSAILHVTTAYSGSDENPSETAVTVKLFNREPFTFNVPGNLRLEDPKLGDLVAEEALKRFKTEVIEAA